MKQRRASRLWPLAASISMCALLAPIGLRGQTVEPEVWRSRLNVRLEEILNRARAERESQIPPRALLEVERTDAGGWPRIAKYHSPSSDVISKGPVDGLAAILRDQGLPVNLLGIAAVESGFNPWALSPKGARGLWQLMPETARRYGLTVEGERDERLDALKSTVAAAQYLRKLYLQFGDWPLVFAAYNAGEDRVERALERVSARDFWTLSRHAALPEETRRYVPRVLDRMAGDHVLGLTSPQAQPNAGDYREPVVTPRQAPVIFARTTP